MDAPPDTDSARTLVTSPFPATRSLRFVRTLTKGIGVVATQDIPAGTLLGYSTGRIITNTTSAGLSSAYVLDVAAPNAAPNAPPLFSIDASHANVDASVQPVVLPKLGLSFTANEQQTTWTRYINSVNPEDARYSQNVDFVYSPAMNRVEVVTRRAVRASEELLTDYGERYLFGDGAADILPLGDLLKTEVRELAAELDIPCEIIAKAPRAGLWEGQTDEIEIGIRYDELDKILLARESGDFSGVASDPELLERVKQMFDASRHKRERIAVFKR